MSWIALKIRKVLLFLYFLIVVNAKKSQVQSRVDIFEVDVDANKI